MTKDEAAKDAALTAAMTAPSGAATPKEPAAADQHDMDGWGPRKDNWEVTLSGVGSNDSHFNIGGFQVDGNVGYYLTDQFEVALRQNVAFADSNTTSSRWDGATRGAVDFLIPVGTDRLYPFVGGSLGYLYGDSIRDTWAAGPEVGLKWYVKPKTFLQVQGEYQFFFRNTGNIGDNFDNGSFLYSLGFGINF